MYVQSVCLSVCFRNHNNQECLWKNKAIAKKAGITICIATRSFTTKTPQLTTAKTALHPSSAVGCYQNTTNTCPFDPLVGYAHLLVNMYAHSPCSWSRSVGCYSSAWSTCKGCAHAQVKHDTDKLTNDTVQFETNRQATVFIVVMFVFFLPSFLRKVSLTALGMGGTTKRKLTWGQCNYFWSPAKAVVGQQPTLFWG